MEGKSALFKRFAGIDAWPLCLDTQDPDLIVEIVRAVSPGFAGINLEDISAPRCFEIEARLREILDIPVFHDDQHGTAIVVLAALTNALRVVGKDLGDVRIVMSGRGSRGYGDPAAAARGRSAGRGRRGRRGRRLPRPAGAARVAARARRGHQQDGPDRHAARGDGRGRRVHRRLGARTSSTATTSRGWPKDAIVFALANPVPEIDPGVAREHAAVVATGRSDYPNQINNVLAFPGVFRGLLDASANQIDDSLLVAAAEAIAGVVSADELNANYIIPSVFHADVHTAVATAVRHAAEASSRVATLDLPRADA